jgi:hypothetical protein
MNCLASPISLRLSYSRSPKKKTPRVSRIMLSITRALRRHRVPLSAVPAFVVVFWVASCRWPGRSIGGWDLSGVSGATRANTVSAPTGGRAGVAEVGLEDRLEGLAAKRRVVELLDQALARLERFSGYTATVRMRERIRGVLGDEQRFEMKLRHGPFAVYLKSLDPVAGREAIYAEGRHGNKMVAHQVGWTRHITPRLVLAPTNALVLAYSRHPITEAGIAHMARSLRRAAQLDLGDDGTQTVLARVSDGDGRMWLYSTQNHTRPGPERSFARVEVFYDPATSLPLRMAGYDWPKPGDAGGPHLAEQCVFDDLQFEVTLSDRDFDPDNPAYDFNPH